MDDKLIKFTFQTWAQHGRSPVKVEIQSQIIEIAAGQTQWSVTVPDTGHLDINWFNKSESDTIIENNVIVADSEWRIEKIWVDNILTESWFRNQACYRPRYFQGFLDQCSDAPSEIFAPYQFNFPGTVSWQWSGEFWDWYFLQKNKNEVINFLDRDPDRVWKFRGSLDPCQDLVEKIKQILAL